MNKKELKMLTFGDNSETGYIEEEYQIFVYDKILTYHNYADYEKLVLMLYADNEVKNIDIQRLFNFNGDKIIVKARIEAR